MRLDRYCIIHYTLYIIHYIIRSSMLMMMDQGNMHLDCYPSININN